MAGRGFVSVQVVAVHVQCDRCGDRQRVQHNHDDGFTRLVLQPLVSWWTSHYAPRLLMFEVLADGQLREWKAAS